MVSNIGITNGLSFTDNSMYLSDSLTGELLKYDYYGDNLDKCSLIEIYNPSFETPDGANIIDNMYCSAMWGGSRILCYDLEKHNIQKRINLMTKYTTSCCSNGEFMFITTAKEDDKSEDAGKVFYERIKY